jgi:predicted dehydrogenase
VLEHAWALPERGGMWLESETEVIGTAGVARIRTPSDAVELLGAGGHEQLDPAVAAVADDRPAIALKEQLSYLTHCIRDARQPERLTPEDALRAHRVALRVVETSRGPVVRPNTVDTTC